MTTLALRPQQGLTRPTAIERDEQVVAVLAPMSGSAGIWGPSCISCAQVAVSEANADNGAAGAKIVPYFLDSDDGSVETLEREIAGLLEEKAISAIVGMSVSSVRQRLTKIIGGRVPYIYTPQYEGNEHSPNVFTIGETAADQLAPVIRHMSTELKVRNWALIGNDYVWPRSSHAVARQRIAEAGGAVVFDGYVPFGLRNAEWLVERIAATKPEIVLVSLIGQDAVEFNRAFGAMDMHHRMFRLSTVIEENVLLATGEENTKRLFVASCYFGGLETDQNEAFKERYRANHPTIPPVLNALGQSLYEGIHFYAAMREKTLAARRGPVRYRSARSGAYLNNDTKDVPIYLSRAEGHQFAILGELS